MKIQKNDGVLSFGTSDDIRISRISATGNLDISGNSNLILDVSGVGVKVLNPTCLLDVSGTVNTKALKIGGATPRIYVKSCHWLGINVTHTVFQTMIIVSYANNDKWSWSVGFVPNITWYGLSFIQDDDTWSPNYEIKIYVDPDGNGYDIQDINTGGTPTVFDLNAPAAKREAVYADLGAPFTTKQGDRIKIEIQATIGGSTTEECNLNLFGYYELT